MGYDGSDMTQGYMVVGEVPSFKIFESSTGIIYDAMPSEDIPFENSGGVFLDYLEGGILGCTDESACNFDISVTVDDGSCIYAEGGNDCEGNCNAALGDVNGDSEINILDLVQIANLILETSTPPYACAADFNGDGEVNILDLVQIVNYILEN